jgi:hypothetical protein
MSNCKKDHSDISSIMNELPIEQGGAGRHKCAACAYEKGVIDGYSRTLLIDINAILENLPTSQAGSQRHKSAYLGYIRGYCDGLSKYYQEVDGFSNQSDSNYGYRDEGDPMQLEESNSPDYHIDANSIHDISDESHPDSTLPILNYKISDLFHHTFYLFNDFDSSSFSIRTLNALHAQGIITLQDVLDYRGNVLDIPKAGRKAQLEFEYLKDYIKNLLGEQYEEITPIEDETINHNELITTKVTDLLKSLDGEKRAIAEYDYKRMVKEIGNNRAIIFISKYSFEKFVYAFCYKSDNDIINMRGVGRNKADSLMQFRDSMTKYLEELSSNNYSPLELRWELINRQLNHELQMDYKSLTGQDLKDYYLSNKHLPVLKLLDIVFHKLSSSASGSYFLQKYFRNTSDYDLVEEDITYERKRQKANEVFNALKNRDVKISSSDKVLYDCVLAYCYLLSSNDFVEYIKAEFNNKDILTINEISGLLSEERCQYLKEREALSIIGLTFSDYYYSKGGTFNDDDFENVFMIKKELCDIYNFTTAISFFREENESHHTTTEVYNIPTFVRDGFEHWKDGITQYEYIERITSILSTLIRVELNLEDCLFMDELTLKPNAEVSPKDLVYEALKSLGKPSTPEEILNKLVKNNHHAISSVNDVRYYLRDTRIVFTKFEGKYDLVSNHPDIGSYRDFIRKILNESNVPLSPEDIYMLMPESRKVGFDKFRSNLGVFQEVRRYIGGLYGLCDKSYDERYILDIQNFTAGDKLAKITIFYRDNNRLPKASDGPEWRQLRSWWDSLTHRSDSLSTEELKTYTELKAEVANPGQSGRFDSEFMNVANKIKEFIIDNRRMPSKDSESAEESILGQWFVKQEKRMAQETLSPNQMSIFIVLLKIKSRYVD